MLGCSRPYKPNCADHRYAAAMKRTLTWLLGLLAPLTSASAEPPADSDMKPLRIAVIGLVHGHVEGLLCADRERQDLEIVGIYEPDRELFERLASKYQLNESLWHADLGTMLDQTKPEAVSVMTSIRDHEGAVRACAPRGIAMLVEKPLAFDNDAAQRMAALAREHKVLLLTNFETSWYSSLREAKRLVESGTLAPIRRMVFRHGHKGPREIGCSPEFLAWLTDPDQSGGGAVVDFGCYGALLSTWFMEGKRPTRITATASTLKPLAYPNVDDDATIVLEYPGATSVIQASWAWTHDNKEADLHTERGSVHCGKWQSLQRREPDQAPRSVQPSPMPGELKDEWTYLRRVVRGESAVDPLSSLEINLIVVEILHEARRQIRTAKSSVPPTP